MTVRTSRASGAGRCGWSVSVEWRSALAGYLYRWPVVHAIHNPPCGDSDVVKIM